MARRSARLQKRSPTPESTSSHSSWETAQSQSSPQSERLATVTERSEPIMQTPQKPVEKPAARKPQAASQASQAMKTPTGGKDTASKSSMTATSARTPKDHTPIKPAGQEMHPAHHHASTAKVLDEARWLGFQALGAHTAPPKSSGAAPTTPTKTPVPNSTKVVSPGFHFRFKSPLSPKASSILKGDKGFDATGGRTLFVADEFTTPADVGKAAPAGQRKTAVPKGKISRFSDVHMAEFKKMDSIANHPSAFRADPSRFKPVDVTLKKSPSKSDMSGSSSGPREVNKLKRTQSKMDLAETAAKTPAKGLKRTQSKMDMAGPPSKIPPTPSKPTHVKMDTTAGSGRPRSQSSVRVVPPTHDGRPASQDGNPFAKRVKLTEADDAASTRPVSQEEKTDVNKPALQARKVASQSALPRLASRLMTPTKSSLARSQSVKAAKSTSKLPSLMRSPSANNMFSPTNIGQSMKNGVCEGMRKTSNSIQRVRSILRTPNRKFSDDPEKIAAGTHMSPPAGLDLAKELPKAPLTAPIKKHVNFTNSTLERAGHDEVNKSPSPMKPRAGSEVPTGAVVYPAIQSGVDYPQLPIGDQSPAGSPTRRLTFGGTTNITPSQFSFKSDKSMNFGPSSTGTIRMVRNSDASSLADGKKRKLSTVEETSDKENNGPPAEDEGRSPAKKMKTAPAPPKTPSSASKLPRRTPKRGSSISKSRLAFLATPKRG